jgi:hypothetical protein
MHTRLVPKAAPRYDPRLLTAARAMDDESKPMAETCRQVGALAERLGVPRPSYVHLRRFLRAERLRRQELRELIGDVLDDVARHRPVDTYVIADRLSDIEGHRRIRARS